MPQHFDWQSEEDNNWVVLPAVMGAVPRPRLWFTRLLILLALSTALIALWRQTGQRVNDATANVRADILAAHDLTWQAVAQNDIELFRAQLARHDPAWVATQERLLADGLILDRAPFGLSLPPAGASSQAGASDVQIAPDLQSAEVVVALAYAVSPEPGGAEMVSLRQTAFYRLDDHSWRLVSPERAFWGEWITRKSRLLTVIYPEHDQEVAVRLAADLEATLAAICASLVDITCPVELRLILRLETDPVSLVATTTPASLIVARNGLRRLTLPAPTLVGLPTDEASYHALYQGYAAQLTLAIDNYLAEWACCVPFR